MIFHTDPTDTITVEEKVYGDGDRSVRARINDGTSALLRLFQSGDYCSESVELHLNERDRETFNVSVDTFEGHYPGDKPWAALKLSGDYTKDTGARGHKESIVYLSAENLVEIRDELTKEIRRARKAGHIS